ncbi:MAG TPA: hypothetical protein VH186_30885 [Chloroflexia bacterium]|nr:hypothetical protein [Chloroflexia bacterium]
METSEAGLARQVEPKPINQSDKKPEQSRREIALKILWPLILYAFLAIVFTWPLVLHLTDRGIQARSTDLWQNLWNIWWMKHSIFELHTNPFHTSLLFYPDSPVLYLHALNPLGGLLSVPLQWLFGLVTAFNLMVLLVFTFSGYSAYLLGRYLKLSRGAAFLVGVIFAFSPIISSELNMGQLEQLTLLWIPLFLLFFLKAVDSGAFSRADTFEQNAAQDQRRYWLYAGLAALFLLCTALTTWYYALDLLIFATLAGLALGVSAIARRNWAILIRLGGVALLCGLFLAPLLFLTARAAVNTPTAAARDSSVRYNSSFLLHFLTPGDSTLWFSGPIAGQEFRQFLGFVALALAGVAVVTCWKRTRGWLALLLVFLVLSMGPQFKTGIDSYLDIPLPGAWLQALPLGGSLFRVPVRMVAFAMLPLGLMAGIGLDWLKSRLNFRFRRPVLANAAFTGLIVGLVFLEAFPGSRQTIDLTLDKAAWSKIQPPGAVFSLPYADSNSLQMFEQTVHGQPLVGGYLARLPLADFVNQAPIVRDLAQHDFIAPPKTFPGDNFEATLLPALNVYGIRYLVIHRDLMSAERSAGLDRLLQPILKNNLPLAHDGSAEIYRIPQYNWNGTPLAGWIDWNQGWYQEESTPVTGPYRWTGQNGTLNLLNPNPQPVHYKLEWTLFSYHHARQVQLILNGKAIGSVEAGPPDKAQSLDLELPPGFSTLQLSTSEAPELPSQVEPGNPDHRLLGFAVARARLVVAQP